MPWKKILGSPKQNKKQLSKESLAISLKQVFLKKPHRPFGDVSSPTIFVERILSIGALLFLR